MSALYNEIDAFAAQWTRNLIAGGHVAPGVVDERSISDLTPADVAGPGQRHFFAGIAGWSAALRLACVPDTADVWTGSCPCQGFSDAGKRRGFDDERHLWPVWFALIRECRPAIVLGEQVASKLGRAWLDLVFADLEGIGYSCAAADLPVAGVGAPHRRQRLFFVAYAAIKRGSGRRKRDAHGWSQIEPERFGFSSGMADRDDARLEVVGEQPARRQRSAAQRSSKAGRVADGSRVRRGQGIDSGQAGSIGGAGLADGRGPDELADADGVRRDGEPGHVPPQREQPDADRSGETGAVDVDDPSFVRSWRDTGAVPRAQGQHDRRLVDVPRAAGATRGFWADAEWIACRDGKARAVEPGSFPLSHGVPGRVGQLRGYGNAISPEIAAAFVIAALEAA